MEPGSRTDVGAAAHPPRVLPKPREHELAFWTGGADGVLSIQRCEDCERWCHPPQQACPQCSGHLAPTAVSGGATVYSFTVNYQRYRPEVPPPYVIALVELPEQPELRLVTDIVDCDPDLVHVGMPVQVRFERHGDVYVPVFAPK